MPLRRRTSPPTRTRRVLFGRQGAESRRHLAQIVRSETLGGALLAAATVTALLWANSPARDGYERLRDTVVGPAALHLNLTLGGWATDGLLAIFFFVVGLELRREFTVGDLRNPAQAVLPIVGAIGGMAVPAVIYLAVNLSAPGGAPSGWAIPTATDIAFAVAVLALVNTHLPGALRAFLLTLAVVDDLLAITIIAIAYSSHINLALLGAALAGVAVFALLVWRRWTSPWLLMPLGITAWALMHASGIHATIAGVLLGLVVPATERRGESESVAERFEYRFRPISTCFAVPVFALFAAGVTLDPSTLSGAVSDPVARGVALGLVLGKPIGILAATALVARFTRAQLDPGLSWWDMVGVGLVGGIGFTVSLLIGELAFGEGSVADEHVKIAILVGSACAALVGGFVLWLRNRSYRGAEGAPEASTSPAADVAG